METRMRREGELLDLETNNETHWHEVRERAAIAAMQAIISNPNSKVTSESLEIIPQNAVCFAEYLVEELKKQNEQNLDSSVNTCKDDSEFKVGDWIVVRGEAILICDIRNDLYGVIFADGAYRFYDTNILDKESRLWTIGDAKDGDVLAASDGSIFLFAGVIDCACKFYVAITTDGQVCVSKKKKIEGGYYWETARAAHPATKEQRNLLFQKMKEAGYEWNAEKKELKKYF